MPEVSGPRPVALREEEAGYEALGIAPSLELGVLTSAGTTELGGGFARFQTEGELADWTLEYDEVFFVLSGELAVSSDGETERAGPGGVLLIPKGATVTYRGSAGTKAFFVLHPRDWAERAELDSAGSHDARPRT